MKYGHCCLFALLLAFSAIYFLRLIWLALLPWHAACMPSLSLISTVISLMMWLVGLSLRYFQEFEGFGDRICSNNMQIYSFLSSLQLGAEGGPEWTGVLCGSHWEKDHLGQTWASAYRVLVKLIHLLHWMLKLFMLFSSGNCTLLSFKLFTIKLHVQFLN